MPRFGQLLRQQVRQAHLAELLVVAVGFAVRADVDQLVLGGGGVEGAQDAVGPAFGVDHDLLEGHAVGEAAVVEEEGQGLAWPCEPGTLQR